MEKTFPQARLLFVTNFRRHCRDRGIEVEAAELEWLQREGWVPPILRVRRPEVPDEGGGGENHGGRKRYGMASTHLPYLSASLERGLLVFPEEEPFKPWKEFVEGGEPVEMPMYHPLQALAVREGLALGTVSLDPSILNASPEEAQERMAKARRSHDLSRHRLATWVRRFDNLMRLLLRVEDAFLPDLRRRFTGIDPAEDILKEETAWWEWRRSVSWSEVLESEGWTPEALRSAYETWALTADYLDPLKRWYLLVQQIPYRKRQKLGGMALLAQDTYEVALVLRALYREVTGDLLPPPDEVTDAGGGRWKEDRYGARDVLGDRQARRRLLTEFGLNPAYRVHLLLEGEAEGIFVQEWAEARLGGFERADIHVDVLGGAGEVKVGLMERRLYHVVEEGAVAYLIVDNDERVEQHVRDLLKRRTDGIPLLHEDFCRIWDREFEEDNFSFEEISTALNEVAAGLGNSFRVASHQLEAARATSPERGLWDILDRLAREEGADFVPSEHKTQVAKALTGPVVERIRRPLEEAKYEPVKPIEQELEKALQLALDLKRGMVME